MSKAGVRPCVSRAKRHRGGVGVAVAKEAGMGLREEVAVAVGVGAVVVGVQGYEARPIVSAAIEFG